MYASGDAACLSSKMEHTAAKKICEKVAKEVKTWARKRKYAESSDIFKKVIIAMKKHNEDAAFMYETHRDIS